MTRSMQVTLFDGNNTEWEIKKHSSIIQMGNVTTLQERKAMNSLIWIAKDFLKRNTEQRIFQCDIGIVKRLSGLNDSNNDDLKDALRNLSSTKIEYNILNKDKKEWGVFSFLAEVKIVTEGRGKPTTITFEFPTTVWNVVKHPNMYVKLDLLIIRGLNSKHSVALYELLKDYQNLGKYRCGIEQFRRLMGIKENQYPIFSMLRKRVLDRAVEEINNKTDLLVSYTLEKVGRKIVAIIFSIGVKEEYITSYKAKYKIEEKLKSFGMASKVIQNLLSKHNEQFLLANIAIVEEQMKKKEIPNPIGYLLKVLQNNESSSETEYSKLEQAKKQEAKKEQLEKQKVIDELDARKREIENKKIELVKSKLAEQDQQLRGKWRQEFLIHMNSNPIFSKMLESKGFEDKLIQIQWHKFLEPILLSEEECNFESLSK